MRLKRMGASHHNRLSFMRSLVRRMAGERWGFERLIFDVDAEGYGTSVYAARTPTRTYSLVAFTRELEPGQRSDRVIAEAWDATFNLFDGVPTEADLVRLAENTPRQESGRFTTKELSVARANKSLRAFKHVVDALAVGRQPDIDFLSDVGYLMRTTAVYGSGKYGCADNEKIAQRPEMRGPFQVEMLAVYLIRWFTIDLVEHVARSTGGRRAVALHPAIKRFLGIGNSTGLGMAPFLVKHPELINNWVVARETALMRVRNLPSVTSQQCDILYKLTNQIHRYLEEWVVEDKVQACRITKLRSEMVNFEDHLLNTDILSQEHPWNALYLLAESAYSLEGQELITSLILEPHGDLIDDLADTMCADRAEVFDPVMTVAEVLNLLENNYCWALKRDYKTSEEQQYFWYYSEDKLEPRFSNRYCGLGVEWEMPLAIGRDVAALEAELMNADPHTSIAAFLIRRPEFRHIVRRVQTTARFPYGEIYDSLISSDVRPIDLLRFKLAFFGASKFDPKSDLWTRITMFQGAPMPHELCDAEGDGWAFPVKPEVLA